MVDGPDSGRCHPPPEGRELRPPQRSKNMRLHVLLKGSVSLAACILLPHGVDAGQRPIGAEYRVGGFVLGCQAYTFHRFTTFEAIEKTAAAGGKAIEFYPGQALSPEDRKILVEPNASDETIEKLKTKAKRHGLLIVNFGVVGIPKDEAGARRVFEFAKKLGALAITIEPSADQIDLIEKLIKEYDTAAGIHCHPKRAERPEYKLWDPNYVFSLVKDRDRRFGVCADVGHWTRSGVDAVALILGVLHSMRIFRSGIINRNQHSGAALGVTPGTDVSHMGFDFARAQSCGASAQ